MEEEKQESAQAEDTGITQHTLDFDGMAQSIAMTPDGTCYIGISAVCKALDIDHRAQLRRIRHTPGLQEQVRAFSLKTAGGTQVVQCLPVELISVWLANLQSSTVRAELRPRLHLYHYELSDRVVQDLHLSGEKGGAGRGKTARRELASGKGRSTTGRSPAAEERDGEALAAEHALAIQIPAHQPRLLLPGSIHDEDRAFREASLAKASAWERDEQSPEDPHFTSSRQIQVYVSHPSHPLGVATAMARIEALGISTVLTARILWGLWNLRERDPRFSYDGWAAVDVEEILRVRGVQMHKHKIPAPRHEGGEVRASETQEAHAVVSDQYYDRRLLDLVSKDLVLIQGCHIRRWSTSTEYTDFPYLQLRLQMHRSSRAGKEQDRIIRIAVKPGEWMPPAMRRAFHRFTAIDQRIFQLRLHLDLHEICLALYLVERWREQALLYEFEHTPREQAEERDPWKPFRAPISMQSLLDLSKIEVDRPNLTTRFAPRIEQALQKLSDAHILGAPAQRVEGQETNETRHSWSQRWLQTQWVLLPALDPPETASSPEMMVQPSLLGDEPPLLLPLQTTTANKRPRRPRASGT